MKWISSHPVIISSHPVIISSHPVIIFSSWVPFCDMVQFNNAFQRAGLACPECLELLHEIQYLECY